MAKPRSDLQIALDALKVKQEPHSKLWGYYNGTNPLRYTRASLADIFPDMNVKYSENWMSVVVQSTIDRMVLLPPSVVDDKALTERVAELFDWSGLANDAPAALECLAVTGEAFFVVWQEESDERPQAWFHDSRLCHAEYDFANPRRMRFAAKWFSDEAGYVHLTLYYPERIEHYISNSAAVEEPVQPASQNALIAIHGDGAFRLDAAYGNEYGRIPVHHLRTTPRRAVSLLQPVLPVQDAVDKVTTDMMVASEYGALKQRWIITNADTSKLKNAPNELWEIPAGAADEERTQVGQFDATDLGNFLNVLNRLSTSIGVISRTPKYYFYQQGGDPSGEALIAMEAPLTRKVQRLKATLAPTWASILQTLLRLDGAGEVALEDIHVAYEAIETVQPLTRAQTIATMKQAGMPLATTLKEDGWTEAELEEVDADRRLLKPSVADREIEARTALMVQQLGGSSETLLTELGYDGAQEMALRTAESEAALELQAKMFEQGDTAGAYADDRGTEQQRGRANGGSDSASARGAAGAAARSAR